MYQEEKDEVVQLYLDDIIPNRFQPREIFDERALKELAISIKEHGVIQPIIVRKSSNGKYEIIAGERRYKASALAGMTKIPAIVRDLDDKESSKVALLENLQRKNLNPIEEARTYQKILELDEMTQEELAKTMGKSQSSIANKIRLLSLQDTVQDAILKEQISERHARALLNIPDPEKQKEKLKKVMDTKMSVRALEEEIKQEYPKENTKAVNETIDSKAAFINDNPLSPTAVIEEDQSNNYGKVVIAPPEGEEETMGKYLNYGEIKSEEDEEEQNVTENNIIPAVVSVNIDDVKNNSNDIEQNSNGTALDNLLNLGNTTKKSDDEYSTPAGKIINADNNEDNQDSNYFTSPDFSTSIIQPDTTNNDDSKFITAPVKETDNNMFSSADLLSINMADDDLEDKTDKSENYTIEEATDKIRALIEELKEHGITINTDEMNFEKSYQIIIKIDKTKSEE